MAAWGLGTFGLRALVFLAFPHHKFEANFPTLLLVILYIFTIPILNSTVEGEGSYGQSHYVQRKDGKRGSDLLDSRIE